MNVLFLAAEATPFIKVGGLGDVAGELPRALRRRGVDVRLALPLHAGVDARGVDIERTTRIEVQRASGAEPVTVHTGRMGDLPVFLVDGEPIRSAAGLYGEPASDAFKFTLFSLAALAACETFGWAQDVVHANDWHTAPAIIALDRQRNTHSAWRTTATLLSLHNLPFMGVGGEAGLQEFGLTPASVGPLPEWARGLPLPLGLLHADAIAPVSPSYGREIQSPEFGCGLEGFFASRQADIRGILNGIDPDIWNPSTDRALRRTFDRRHLDRRASNKAALEQELGWEPQPDRPLLAMVTRMDAQKGVDLALQALPRLADLAWRFVLLGTGDPALEQGAAAFADAHADRVRFLARFDPGLSRRMYGGADLLLVPSRYEPCGLAQMIAMRYGCLPLVHAVGGLRDTVIPADVRGAGTGFLFEAASPTALGDALRRALSTYDDRARWAQMQRNAMSQDFSWEESAAAYQCLYEELVERRAA